MYARIVGYNLARVTPLRRISYIPTSWPMPETTPRPRPPPMTPEFLRYAVAGAAGTAVHYATLVALMQFAHALAVAASTAGAIVGALINYVLNHRFTFASAKSHDHALPRFVAVALTGIAINAIVMAAMLGLLGAHYLVAQVVATFVVLVAGYRANRAWTF